MEIPESSFMLEYAQQLIQLASVHSEWIVRFSAAEVLADRQNRQGLPELLKALRHQNAFIRDRASKALGNFNDQEVIAALQKMLADPDPETRGHALVSLARAAWPNTTQKDSTDQPKQATSIAFVMDAICKGFADNNAIVQECALTAAKFTGENSYECLSNQLHSNTIFYPVQLMIATYLASQNQNQGKQFLYHILENQDTWLAFLAARQLALLHDPKGVPQLKNELIKSNWEEKIKALEALLELGIQDAAITEVYQPKDQNMPALARLEILRLLYRIQPEQSAQRLHDEFKKGDDNVKNRIIEIIAELKKPELLDIVQTVIDNGPEHLRAAVVMAVEKLENWEYALRLWPMLDRSHWLVRLQVARVLLKLHQPVSTPS